MKKSVLILFGGNSKEHAVSCASVKSILENIDKSKYNVVCVGITKNLDWYVFDDSFNTLTEDEWYKNCQFNKIENITRFLKRFNVIFPIIHGYLGEDGKLQGLLECIGVPFVGSSVLSSALCMDKIMTKRILSSQNIHVVPYYYIFYDGVLKLIKEIPKIEKTIKYPYIIKPSNGGSSIGVSLVKNRKELIKGIKRAAQYDKYILIEQYIKAQEIECAILQRGDKLLISTAGEIISCNEFYDYNAKYIDNKSEIIIPANIDSKVSFEIRQLAKKAFKIFQCKDFARIDFFYDNENKKIYLNEINTIPGFTNISMYPKLISYDGINYKHLINILIENNIKRY